MSTSDLLPLTASNIAAAVGGRLISGGVFDPILGISIDSRTLLPGDLFFAIQGDRFDGHDFVASALQKGACGAVVSEATIPPDVQFSKQAKALISVGSTLQALQKLSHCVRRASGAQVVAITGSSGKTTTKELIADLLAVRHRVICNRGNFNNHIGLPLSLLELRHQPEIGVMELGMSHAGEISELVAISEPEIRVWTNVSDAHGEFFRSLEEIADAKAEIMDRANSDSVLIVNANDPLVMERAREFVGRIVTFGIQTSADVVATEVSDFGLRGTKAVVKTHSGSATLSPLLLGRGNLANVLAATAVALHYQIPLDSIVNRVAAFSAPDQRGKVVRLSRGITLIDDSYNSNPVALTHVLDTIRQEKWKGRIVAVLGEMLELGTRSDVLHRECGRLAAGSGLDLLISVGGGQAKNLAEAAIEDGMLPSSVVHISTSRAAADVAATLIVDGDLVLVKGSRGVRTDIVVERLKSKFT